MQKLFKNHIFSFIAWVLILIISVVALPDVTGLTREHSNISLPQDVQSEVAQSIQNDWGPKQKNTYQIAVVFNKKNGKLTADDKNAINDTIDRIKENQDKYGIKMVLAPDDNIATKKQLQSKDKTTWILQVNVAKKHAPINEVEQELTKAVKTAGIRTYVTGADVLQNAFSNSIQEGIKKTEVITIVFIFIVLVIVFKSPIVPLISLLTVGVSFITAFSIVTNLVKYQNFPFSNFTQVFMIIVLFGIGTDYNILLYDKFKENLGNGLDRYGAMKDALKVAGKTILYSGSSILIGFSALSLAKFSIYQSAVGVAVGVAILLVVLLTLNPFFMAVLGEKMFWPVKKFTGEHEDKLWHGISKSTMAHPIIYLVVLAVVVTPFALMYSGHLNYDDTDEIDNATPAKAGMLVVEKHFSKGMAEPSTLYIKSDHRLDNEADLRLLDQLTRQIQSSGDVSLVTSVTQPYGERIDQLYVNNQLNTVNKGVDQARAGLSKLSKASKQLSTGASQLASGTSQLQNGTGQLQSGTGQLQSGAGQLQGGAGRLQSGTQQMTSGLNQLNSQLAAGSQGIASAQANTKAALEKSYKANLAQSMNSVPGLTPQQKMAAMQAAGAALEKSWAQASASMPNVSGQMGQLQSGVGRLASASGQLSSGASTLNGGIGQLNSSLGQLNSSVGQLNSSVGKLNSGAGQLADNTPKLTSGLDEVNSGLGQGGAYLTGLASSSAADSFYIPKEFIKNDMFQTSVKNYLSPDKKSAMIMIVYSSNPSSTKATKKAQDLSLMAKKSLAGTRLDKATIAMGGESSNIADIKDIANKDFIRTAAIMLIGIGIALIFVTRSLLQPLYILGTLLIAYFCSLSITEWVVKATMGKDMLTWNTPFFGFILLIALGVDYSIFLMTRYRAIEGGKPSERMLKACGIIGTVVVSAAIILGGTFAALIPSGIPTLIEVALTVIIGLIILVFIMPITLSAAVKLTYEGVQWNKSKRVKQ
ncbi:MMPL family transporter [Lactobacillus apis]|uniref:RND superfamily resistance-nodulation-cell division:proton (H+) antiporter n=1 Tax=Lactobacillus apis TaxID=303541 RepID=A0A0F4LUC9_9LACO|nr:MMPL family transporter [Lactobacillus apis]KJY62240.1 RND superfamily resistance-nodulation-cell division:proton (H+) antiporter [Lactobacillus apis]